MDYDKIIKEIEKVVQKMKEDLNNCEKDLYKSYMKINHTKIDNLRVLKESEYCYN